jgi:hypothetical protein
MLSSIDCLTEILYDYGCMLDPSSAKWVLNKLRENEDKLALLTTPKQIQGLLQSRIDHYEVCTCGTVLKNIAPHKITSKHRKFEILRMEFGTDVARLIHDYLYYKAPHRPGIFRPYLESLCIQCANCKPSKNEVPCQGTDPKPL